MMRIEGILIVCMLMLESELQIVDTVSVARHKLNMASAFDQSPTRFRCSAEGRTGHPRWTDGQKGWRFFRLDFEAADQPGQRFHIADRGDAGLHSCAKP